MKQTFQYLLLAFLAVFVLNAVAEDRPADYQLAAGDNIRIVVFRNPDLTLETRVSEGGSITYPLIGAVRIGGLTISAAETRIADQLKEGGFLERPQVNIVLLQVRGNQVVVLGQLMRPGRYPLETNNMHLSDIISLAGGVAATGADVAILTGIRDAKAIRLEIDIPGIFINRHAHNDVLVSGGDIVYVQRAPTFYVYGEVQKPGSYRIERGMFVMQALAQAGGVTLRGTQRRLRLYRRNGGGILEALSPELTTEIKADDVLYVDERLF